MSDMCLNSDTSHRTYVLCQTRVSSNMSQDTNDYDPNDYDPNDYDPNDYDSNDFCQNDRLSMTSNSNEKIFLKKKKDLEKKSFKKCILGGLLDIVINLWVN